MAGSFFPLEGCKTTATAIRTALANSVLHLFKDTLPDPDPSVPLATYTTNEATYDGYAPVTFATWQAPLLAPGNGYMIQSPWAQFLWEFDTDGVTNNISGCYLVDAAGKLRMTIVFVQVAPMQMADQGIPISLIWFFRTNAG